MATPDMLVLHLNNPVDAGKNVEDGRWGFRADSILVIESPESPGSPGHRRNFIASGYKTYEGKQVLGAFRPVSPEDAEDLFRRGDGLKFFENI